MYLKNISKLFEDFSFKAVNLYVIFAVGIYSYIYIGQHDVVATPNCRTENINLNITKVTLSNLLNFTNKLNIIF